MDGVWRANAVAGVDERVPVQPTEARPARALLLSAVEALRTTPGSAQAAYLTQLLDGIPVMAGDQVRANLFGARTQSFVVVETSPAGPVLIGPSTTIRFAVKDAQL